jgi:DNA processing protein
VLIVQGIPDLSLPRVAVVGPRRPDDYGLEMAGFFAGALGRCGVTVVSGGAAGIDTAAHEACLGAGGLTFCVLGCGFLMPFPEDNAPLFSRLGMAGGHPDSCLISEYSPGMPAQPHQFPERNRIVAALSDAVIVIQAGYPSGALITARLAIEMGIPVFAVPADIHWKGSSGTNDLLGRGAVAICRPGDLESVPGLRGCGLADVPARQVPRTHGIKSPWQRAKAPALPGPVSPGAEAVLREIVRIHGETGCGADMERLAGAVDGPPRCIQAGLLELELAGLVERRPGGIMMPVSRGGR